jgi:8-oxo-dGTP diphosphatase
MESEIIEKYGNRLRVRVCGLCWKDGKLLMANHHISGNNDFWAPIGGGVEFGETAHQALVREFLEESSIHVRPGNFLFGCELIRKPLHAIELFFEVIYESGQLLMGADPESDSYSQILKEVRFMEFDELMALEPDERHAIFRIVKSAAELKNLTGYYRI